MNKKILVLIIIALIVLTSCSMATTLIKQVNPVPTPYPIYPIKQPRYSNLTKLIIIPEYKYLRLEPGKSAEFTVTIKNPNNKDVVISPKVIINPLSTNYIPKEWIKINRSKFLLKANQTAEVEITVKIPKNAEKGFYNCQIVFTNDKIQTPYLSKYINVLRLSVNVYVPPSVFISPKYINDYVLPGKTYNYTIKIINKANRSFSLKPEFTLPEYIYTNTLSKEDVKVISPSKIPPNSKVNVTVEVKIPPNAKGVLRGEIKLNINDPGLDQWMQKVELNLNVYTIPAKPFVKTFVVKNAKLLKVKVSSNFLPPVTVYGLVYGLNAYKGYLEVKLISPSGKLITKPEILEKYVITTYSTPPWIVKEGLYKTVSQSKTYIYTINNPENGIWKVEITPKGVLGFTLEIDTK